MPETTRAALSILLLCIAGAACGCSSSTTGPTTEAAASDACAPVYERYVAASDRLEQGPLAALASNTERARELVQAFEDSVGEDDAAIEEEMTAVQAKMDELHEPTMEQMLALESLGMEVAGCFKEHRNDSRVATLTAMQERFDAMVAAHTELVASYNAAITAYTEASEY